MTFIHVDLPLFNIKIHSIKKPCKLQGSMCLQTLALVVQRLSASNDFKNLIGNGCLSCFIIGQF